MPQPLSATRMSRQSALTVTSIFVAPLSIEFSTNSLTTDEGRSITSPAAIWLAIWSGRTDIRGTSHLYASADTSITCDGNTFTVFSLTAGVFLFWNRLKCYIEIDSALTETNFGIFRTLLTHLRRVVSGGCGLVLDTSNLATFWLSLEQNG
jgi:hypothetical protein